MKMFHKLVATASMATLAATGAASALDITNSSIGTQPTSTATPYSIANELDLDGVSTALVTRVDPTTGALPAGNVLLTISLTNATFEGNVLGNAIVGIDIAGLDCSDATASISSGGASGQSSVTFLVSNAQGCDTSGDEGLQFTQNITPTGAGSVVVTANLQTEALNQVDGPSVTETVLSLASGFSSSIVADTGTTQADLPDFLAISGDNVLGTVRVNLATGINSDFAGTDVAAGDIEDVTVTVTGDMSAFAAGTVFVDLNGNTTFDAGEELTVTGNSASAVFTGVDVTSLTTDNRTVRVVEDGIVPIVADQYNVSVVVNPDDAAATIPFLAADETTNGALDEIVREGTQITMPWFASGTQATNTLSNNLVRLGNVSSTPITAVYAQVLNASNDAFINPGVTLLPGVSIGVGETFLLTGQTIEDAVGNWGTGDVQITVEAPESALTARRFIFNGSTFTEASSGTVEEDKN